MEPASKQAHKLFLQGSVALSEMCAVGMPVSKEKLDETDRLVTRRIQEITEELRNTDVYKEQRRRYGKETNINSKNQLATILYDHFKLPGAKISPKDGKYILNAEALEDLDIPYAAKYLEIRKYTKLKSTCINGLRNELVNGRVHGFLSLHNVTTYRGSSDSPNLNNLPSRDSELAGLIKSCICPAPGKHIVEIDFSNLEVRIGACYHKDPTLLSYLETGYDMHHEIAMQCYKYDDAWAAANPKLAKTLRGATKGDATFSWTYGNYYVDVAYRIWRTATKNNMLGFLASKGIHKLGLVRDPDNQSKWIQQHGPDAFVTHIKEVENDFWNRRFRVYNQWRKSWYDGYQRRGYFKTLTGFVWHGVESKNFVLNCPIQGSAFHCLLQSIILIQEQIRKRRMDSRLFLEVHDSILAEVPDNELDDFIAMATGIMSSEIQRIWPWIITKLPVEVEHSPVSWFNKESYDHA